MSEDCCCLSSKLKEVKPSRRTRKLSAQTNGPQFCVPLGINRFLYPRPDSWCRSRWPELGRLQGCRPDGQRRDHRTSRDASLTNTEHTKPVRYLQVIEQAISWSVWKDILFLAFKRASFLLSKKFLKSKRSK